MRIVIVDDSPLLRDRIKSMLTGILNVSVVGEAGNGVDALIVINREEPELVILDIRMPKMNGIEVLKKIRDSGMKTKVCILTNYPYPQYRMKCLQAGADFFLCKNEEFEDIKAVVASVLLTEEMEIRN